MTSLASQFFDFDEQLARVMGEPQVSSWWRAHLGRFFDAYEAGQANEFWACCGRGGSKSTVCYKAGLFFTLFGEFEIPRSQRHFFTLLSRHRLEAAKGLDVIQRWLDALDEPHSTVADSILLKQLPTRGLRVVSASVPGATGWRSIGATLDEYAKWMVSTEQQLLDADETLTSVRAMQVTHSRAPLIVASSPWLDEGTFFEAITKGDSGNRIVAGPAPSWEANPDAISEADTRKREPSLRRWQREYNAQFVPSFEDGFFDDALLERATDTWRPSDCARGPVERGYCVCIDPAFRGDNFALVVAHCEPGEIAPLVIVDVCTVMTPPANRPLDAWVAAQTVYGYRVRFPGDMIVRSDQHQAEALRSIFQRFGMHLLIEPWTASNKIERYALVRTLLESGRIRLPDDKALRRELSAIGIKRTPSGNELIRSRGGHDDRVSAFVSAVWTAYQFSPHLWSDVALKPQAFGQWRY